jgi:Flp pilus assembly pilin Flp
MHGVKKAPRPLSRLGARARTEDGASAVEFAMLATLLFMIILGMFSGGLAFSRKLALVHAAREGVRYADTLCLGWDGTACGPTTGAIPNAWFEAVAQRTLESASENLAETWDGQYICIAYVGYGSPATSSTDRTRKREKSGTNGALYTDGSAATPSSWCFDDGRSRTGAERRVQVLVRRNTTFEALLWSTTLNLESPAVGRYEVTPPS